MADQRLPIVNSDDGQWGAIIRQYLMKEHFNDDTNNPANGSHQNVTIRPGTATAAPLTFSTGTLLSTPTNGSMEYDGNYFYLTQGGNRKRITINETVTKTGSYTVTANDTFIFANASTGALTLTLPAASGLAGYRFYIKRIDNTANAVTIARSGSDTIDGMASFTLDLQYTSFIVASDGSAWYIF